MISPVTWDKAQGSYRQAQASYLITYYEDMARGWESKSVESQIDASESRHVRAQQIQQSQEALLLQRERESLELSRTRVLRDLETARHPRHREQLAAALAHLDRQIEKLFRAPSVS